MPYVVAILLILAVVIVAGRFLSRANPASVATFVRRAGGVACLVAALFLTVRGALPLAIPLALFGLGLLGFGASLGLNFPFGARTAGQRSQVKTSMLVMRLDHDSGEIEGDVLAGKYEGRSLDDLSLENLRELRLECLHAGDQSAALLDAFLDRRYPGWRTGEEGEAPQPGGDMSLEEARAVLGVKPDAGRAEINAAYKRLMKKHHPDHGGSDYFAARINMAKDVLLRHTG